ncbi:MAG: hypothetical protein ACQERU_07755 [Bacteroidota bacterium]
MKTKIYLGILSFMIFILSCKKINDSVTEPIVKSLTFTDCLTGSYQSTPNPSCLILQAIEGNYLQIQHQKTMFCCGTEQIDIITEIKEDTIYIEEVDLGPFTYCYCWHDIDFTIGPLDHKSYTFQLLGCETSYYRDSILMNFQYADDFYFSNCSPNY